MFVDRHLVDHPKRSHHTSWDMDGCFLREGKLPTMLDLVVEHGDDFVVGQYCRLVVASGDHGLEVFLSLVFVDGVQWVSGTGSDSFLEA